MFVYFLWWIWWSIPPPVGMVVAAEFPAQAGPKTRHISNSCSDAGAWSLASWTKFECLVGSGGGGPVQHAGATPKPSPMLKRFWRWLRRRVFGVCWACQDTGYIFDDYGFPRDCRSCGGRHRIGPGR